MSAFYIFAMITVVSSSFPPVKSMPRSWALSENGELKVWFYPRRIASEANSLGN